MENCLRSIFGILKIIRSFRFEKTSSTWKTYTRCFHGFSLMLLKKKSYLKKKYAKNEPGSLRVRRSSGCLSFSSPIRSRIFFSLKRHCVPFSSSSILEESKLDRLWSKKPQFHSKARNVNPKRSRVKCEKKGKSRFQVSPELASPNWPITW